MAGSRSYLPLLIDGLVPGGREAISLCVFFRRLFRRKGCMKVSVGAYFFHDPRITPVIGGLGIASDFFMGFKG
jgi:hypothetical protein